MWDGINSVTPWIVQGGAVGLALAAVWAVITGRLVPRRVVDDIRADRDARVAEWKLRADEWRTAYQATEEARRHLTGQVDTALESMAAVTRLVGSHKDVT